MNSSSNYIVIGPMRELGIEEINRYVIDRTVRVTLDDSSESKAIIESNRLFLESRLNEGAAIYGVTTGFGNSSDNSVAPNLARQLQNNLISYHGCGVGPYLSEEECAAALLVRLNCNAKGFSGVRWTLLEKLTQLADKRLIPAMPSLGSVGASGDLTPLSYIAACLRGERAVYENGQIVSTREAFERHEIEPLSFEAKEGLAIMNGTSVMSGIAVLNWQRARRLADLGAVFSALIVEVLEGRTAAFAENLHRLKPHPGQLTAARKITRFLAGAESRYASGNATRNGKDQRVQDSYSLRCAPQVIGVLYDVLEWTRKIFEVEINSVNDNPVIRHDERQVLNGGHFYGGHVAAACDALKTAVSNVLSLLDKQMAILVDPRLNHVLPANLVASADVKDDPALHHGFKAMQITMTALVAEALKQSIPMSIFARPTECQNQDVVSMGTVAARDFARVVELGESVLAIYGMALRQAFYVKGEISRLELNGDARAVVEWLSARVMPVTTDRPLDREIGQMASAMRDLMSPDLRAICAD